MLLMVVTALALAATCQSLSPDRSRAEQLGRSGQTIEAIELFQQILEQNPADIEARLWIARLELRLGHADDAEAGFRLVIADYPRDIDARIGLASVLMRKGVWREALDILVDAERDAGENSDLYGALARAYRRGGDDRRALEYFRRAKALAPDDPDIAAGFEAVARSHGHWIAFEGFGQSDAPGENVNSGSVTIDVRAAPRLHLQGSARIQQGLDYSDAVGGGGLTWRIARTATASFRVVGGSQNTALPRSDIAGDVVHYAGVLEIGGSIRRLSFVGTDVAALSPVFAWNPVDRWRLDGRYTYSRSSFNETGQTRGDHSVLLRPTWQGWRRAAVQAAYAYGIESFENLTEDRIASFGTTTLATGLRIDVPSLTRITTTWQHQWYSNHTTIDRFTLSVVQSIP